MQNQHPNGICFGVAGGLSNVKLLSKSKDPTEINGAKFERSSVASVESKASGHGRSNSDFVGKQQGRYVGLKPCRKLKLIYQGMFLCR